MSEDLHIIDDSGLLALVDVSTYQGFIGDDWDFLTLQSHIQSQSDLGRIAFWRCGDGGGEYRIKRVSENMSLHPILDTSIKSGAQGLFLVSYSALTMVAQFEDETLPSRNEADLNLDIDAGNYHLQIYQHYEPDDYNFTSESGPHFSLKFKKLS